MTDSSAFLRAIADEPDDDTHRLVFADWLDDHDQGEWATLIRAQCAQQRVFVPWGDPYTDPTLLPVDGLNDRARRQVLACVKDLFPPDDFRDQPKQPPRFSWKLRRGMLEYVEVWGDPGLEHFIARAERLFALVPLADLVLRTYARTDDEVDYHQESLITLPVLSQLYQVPQLTRLRNLDLRATSPLSFEPPSADALTGFARREATTRIWMSPHAGTDLSRSRLRHLLGSRLKESHAPVGNPSDGIPF